MLVDRGQGTRRRGGWVLGVTVAWALSGCLPALVDHFVAGRLIDRAAANGDVDEACRMGAALTDAILAAGSGARSPDRALILSESTAAMCDEAAAWEAELAALQAETTLPASDPARIAAIKDARIRGARHHRRAAARYYRAYQHLEAVWGSPDATNCPRLRGNDAFIYLLGLYAATEAVLHDKAGGGDVGVPLDLLPRVARATTCLDAEAWWEVPRALQAAAWASIPGSAPKGVDPWTQLREAAEAGADSGVRLGWALHALIADNAGREQDVRRCIRAHAASVRKVPPNPKWALLDGYARRVTLHESDLIWMMARGHRTPAFGRLPEDDTAGPGPVLEEDLFEEDGSPGEVPSRREVPAEPGAVPRHRPAKDETGGR